MIPMTQLTAGLVKFVDTEMLPALPTNQRWIAGAIVFVAQGKLPELIKTITDIPLVGTLQLVDSNGNVDIELARKAVKASCQKYGKVSMEVPLLGTFELGEKDFDKLYKCIMSEAPTVETEEEE